MIFLSISLPWPFACSESLRTLYNSYGKLGKNKGWELDIARYHWTEIFKFAVNQTFCCDHAGFVIEACLFGFDLEFRIYDGRHWNYQENRFYERGEYQR
jgi:hypothetical protein